MIADVKCGCGETLDNRDIVPNNFEIRCWKCGKIHSIKDDKSPMDSTSESDHWLGDNGLTGGLYKQVFKENYSSKEYEHWRKSRIP